MASLIGSNWPSLLLPSESDSPIQPGHGEKPPSPVKTPWKVQQKNPEEYEKDRVGKYAQYFKGDEILPIPEILEKLEPRILSLVVTDLKTRRLVGLKKKALKTSFGKQAFPVNTFVAEDLGRPATLKGTGSKGCIHYHHD